MSRSNSADRLDPGAHRRRRFHLNLATAAAVLLLVAVAHALGWLRLAPIERLDLALHDVRLGATATALPDPRIALVVVDERALASVGRWPWPRERLADLLDQLGQRHRPRLIGLDIVMPEPERLGPGSVAAGDRRLADSLARWPVVLGFMLSNETQTPSVGRLPEPVLGADRAARAGDLHHYHHAAANLPLLQQAAGSAGHLNALLDADGHLRRLPLLVRGPDDAVYPALSLALLQRLQAPPGAPLEPIVLPEPPPLATATPGAGRQPGWALVGRGTQALRVPLGPQAEVLPALGPQRAGFTRWSAADVMSGHVPDDALQDKVVIVGVSASGLLDQRMTPVDAAVLGSAVHASALSALMDGQAKIVPPGAAWAEVVLLALTAWAMVSGLKRLGMVRGAALTGGLMVLATALNLAAWQWAHWALPLASLLLLPPALLGMHLVLSYRYATDERQRLARLFGHYVPPELVNEMSRHAERYDMAPRSARLSVLFADVRGFSRIAGQLPPDELSAMMNLLFSHLTDIVREHRGTLDKYIGDAVMAFWGAPLDDPMHARHAVAAGLAMRQRLPRINAELAERGWPPVDVHIGINTGLMVVGDMGSRHRRVYTVLGDAVNLAARLQQFCSQEGLGLVVGDHTAQAIQDLWCLPLGPVHLRGRDAAEAVWWPLPHTMGAQREVDQVCQLWLAQRSAQSVGDGPQAQALLAQVLALQPDFPPALWQQHQLTLARPRVVRA